MNYYLGVDIGTTATKAVAFSPTGKLLDIVSIEYEIYHPNPNWSEQDPNEILRAVVDSINAVVNKMLPFNPMVISFSAAMHSLIAVDNKGNLLTQCIVWADNRANDVATKLTNSDMGAKFYHATGVPIHAMSPLVKLLWLKRNDLDTFNNAYKFIGIKEYIVLKLFETYIIDTSIASATGLLNIKSQEWEVDILDFIGITAEKLSALVPVDYFFEYENKSGQLVIPLGTPIVIGASDGALANLGTGAIHTHTMAITVGTSGAVRMVVQNPVTDYLMRTFCYHLKNDEYIIGGATNNGAIVMQWLKETLLATDQSLEALINQADGIAAGSEDLIFLPYLLGERAPIWNTAAKGVYFGLAIQHTQAHLVKATMEGVVYALYSIAKIIFENKKVTEIHASGGFAKSSLWLQILADVLGIKVITFDTVESAALGAVIIGAQAIGHKPSIERKMLAIYEANMDHNEIYKKAFNKYEQLYKALKELM